MPYHAFQVEKQQFVVNSKYHIIRPVGSGAYGIVCSALNTKTNECVAIKKVCKIFEKQLLTKRCLREIKLLQHFNGHRHIIDLRDMDIVNYDAFNEIYLVQECMDTTLHDIIHSPQRLDEVHYQWFLYQICSGLKYIHSANVLHRDLKPANLLVNANCDLKICDFGLARGYVELDNGDPGFMTQYVATRYYRAPEIMLSFQSYTKAIDMWSVGCIFAELLGRKVLFKGRDYVDQLNRILAILGLPEDSSVWSRVSSRSVVDYVKNLRNLDGTRPPTKPISFHEKFPNCQPEGIDFLERCLRLDPAARCTVEEALEHPYLSQFRGEGEEPVCEKKFDFGSFEGVTDAETIRHMIIDEVKQFKSKLTRRDRGLRLTLKGFPKRRYTGSQIQTPVSATPKEGEPGLQSFPHEPSTPGETPEEVEEKDTTVEMEGVVIVTEPEGTEEETVEGGPDEGMEVDADRMLMSPVPVDKDHLNRVLRGLEDEANMSVQATDVL